MPGTKQILYQRGDPRCLGAYRHKDGMQFSLLAKPDDQAALLLFDPVSGRKKKTITLDASHRIGNVCSVYLPGISPERFAYAFSINGKTVQDPYAKKLADGFALPMEEPKDFDADVPCDIALKDLIIYKLHVRGFTMDKGAGVRHPGTFAGLTEKLPYLASLGVNCIECMPIYTYDDSCEIPGKHNYWGYAANNFYFAPRTELFATDDEITELRTCIAAMHTLQMLFCMEIYVPEGEDAHRVLQALRYWKYICHVDAFHLIGEGVPADLILSDPLLATTKFFFTYRNKDPQDAESCVRIANHHDGFLQKLRAFLRNERGATDALSFAMRGNGDAFLTVQYAASTNGFTLYDSFAYARKHNERNGMQNEDGPRINLSMNCGEEGESKKRKVNLLRKTQMKNALAAVMLSRGIPLLYAGDEFGNSQDGNNNAYALDDPTGWVNWSRQRRFRDLSVFVQDLIRLRKENMILSAEASLVGTDKKGLGLPDVSCHGRRPWLLAEEDEGAFLLLMNGAYAKDDDPALALAFNASLEQRTLALPKEAGSAFVLLLESGKSTCTMEKDAAMLTLAPQSFALYRSVRP